MTKGKDSSEERFMTLPTKATPQDTGGEWVAPESPDDQMTPADRFPLSCEHRLFSIHRSAVASQEFLAVSPSLPWPHFIPRQARRPQDPNLPASRNSGLRPYSMKGTSRPHPPGFLLKSLRAGRLQSSFRSFSTERGFPQELSTARGDSMRRRRLPISPRRTTTRV